MQWQTELNPQTNLQQHVLLDGDTCIAIIHEEWNDHKLEYKVYAIIHEEWNDHKLEYVIGSATFPNLITAKQFAEATKPAVSAEYYTDIN